MIKSKIDARERALELAVEPFEGKIWECACGEKHLARVFEDAGYEVRSERGCLPSFHPK